MCCAESFDVPRDTAINSVARQLFSISCCNARSAKWATHTLSCVSIAEHVERVLNKEEQRFAETLEQGMRILETAIGQDEG